MSSPSNLYAEKVFSEHPIALWALDDQADYVSLVSETTRDLTTWTIFGGTSEAITTVSDEPFIDSAVTRLIGDLVLTPYGQLSLTSQDIVNLNAINADLKTVSIGTYIYTNSVYVSSYEIGYEYTDPDTLAIIQDLKTFNISVLEKWLLISNTFTVPVVNANLRLILKVNYLGGATNTSDYEFLVNGLTLGQWSEEFNAVSLGVQKVAIPSTIATTETYGIEAKAYGFQQSSGYYIVKNNALVAKNSGVPMVYGTSGVTTINANNNNPSVIIPGQGFLNEKGKFKEYTAELWLRLDTDAVDYRKIFGPIASDDGLYVHGPFISFKVGNNVGSHFVGEWFRPMIIHMRVVNNAASLLINGEQVISLTFKTSELTLPDELSLAGKEQDWLGIYSYSDVTPVEIDCVAIYPYQVPSIVAKRRWVYGQGVEFPENINTAYSGTSIFVDYPFADYTNNYNYPDIGKWTQGILENIATDKNVLAPPAYSLPNVIFNNKTKAEWDAAIDTANLTAPNPFLSLSPDASWLDTEGYVLFDNLNIIAGGTKAFYGLFQEDNDRQANQVLFFIEDRLTLNYFEIVFENETIFYNLKYGDTVETLYSTLRYPGTEPFSVAVDIQKLASFYGGNLAAFFGRPASLSLYVGGKRDLQNTFRGKIYKIGLSTQRNLQKISQLFSDNGIGLGYEDVFDLYAQSVDIEDAGETYFGNDTFFWDKFLDGGDPFSFQSAVNISAHTASYTLFAKKNFGIYMLDIAVDSYWEDYVPLTYFGQYIEDASGEKVYDLDLLQLNINYPAPSIFIDDTYDTSDSIIKSYISFQYLESGANRLPTSFTKTLPVPKTGVIDPGTDWLNTKYEVIDNVILYPPTGASFNDLAIVFHIEMVVPGIISNPISVKTLQVASQAFNDVSSNPIGTRFGVPIYPYTKSGVYFDYKNKNPFSIYKSSSPYLYLTKKSGIESRGTYEPSVARGLSIPINQTLSSDYKVIAMQASIRHEGDSFSDSPVQIFEIQSKTSYIKFFMQSIHPDGKRAKIYGVNAYTGQIENGIAFYWNGVIVKEPVMTVNQWGMLGISFSNILNFGSYQGALRVTGPILINNISHYQSTSLQEVQQVVTRPWFKVKYLGLSELNWDYWDSSFLWQGVLVLSSTSFYGVNPADIYKTYTGTNKIIIDDDRQFTFGDYAYSVYKDITWQAQTLTAV